MGFLLTLSSTQPGVIIHINTLSFTHLTPTFFIFYNYIFGTLSFPHLTPTFFIFYNYIFGTLLFPHLTPTFFIPYNYIFATLISILHHNQCSHSPELPYGERPLPGQYGYPRRN